MTTRTARCSCGGISVTVRGEPVINGVCHCNDCKRRTGAPCGWSAYFADDQIVSRTGAPKVRELAGDVPHLRQRRHFCDDCGTMLFWTVEAQPDRTGIAGGCFAPDLLDPPTYSAQDKDRCAWLGLPEDMPRA